jgi:hypothetical protein
MKLAAFSFLPSTTDGTCRGDTLSSIDASCEADGYDIANISTRVNNQILHVVEPRDAMSQPANHAMTTATSIHRAATSVSARWRHCATHSLDRHEQLQHLLRCECISTSHRLPAAALSSEAKGVARVAISKESNPS